MNFTFGTPKTTAVTAPAAQTFGFQQGAGDSAVAPKLFGFATPSQQPQSTPLSVTTAATPAVVPALSAPPPTTTTAGQSGFNFGATLQQQTTASTTKASTLIAPQPIPAPQPAATLASVTKTTDSSNANQTNKLTFSQIEEHINKWTLELEEQEKTFTNQATQINAWDKLLIANNDKIIALNDAVQKVKQDQQNLEQELDFIATQHTELEESIAPLQQNFVNLPQIDIERTQTYQLVENLDTQLKQMSEDLKEVIDYLNESTKNQDNTDPINQIGRILNAHMNSLQWIETSSSATTSKLDDLSKMHDQLKRDSERSFRATYNQLN